MAEATPFRDVPRLVSQVHCSFAKAAFSGCCTCSLMLRHSIAEREVMICCNVSAHDACQELHGLLRHNSAFTLKRVREDEPMTHAQEMKVQCGGLHGLRLALDHTDGSRDVAELVQLAIRTYGKLENLPYSEIVQSVASFKMRRRNDR